MKNVETKAIISDMKNINKLYRRVISEIVKDSQDYNGDNMQERILGRLEDIQHGLSSGIVGSMIYYGDTVPFFNRYRQEIQDLWQEFSDDTGMKLTDLSDFDESDIFVREDGNKNLLAWFAYEEIANQLQNALDE